MSYSLISLEGDCFVYKIRFDGVNFPAKSPVLQKTTRKWEPSTEKLYVRDGVLKGDVNMALLLEGGGHFRCDFKTTYKYVSYASDGLDDSEFGINDTIS